MAGAVGLTVWDRKGRWTLRREIIAVWAGRIVDPNGSSRRFGGGEASDEAQLDRWREFDDVDALRLVAERLLSKRIVRRRQARVRDKLLARGELGPRAL